jgi:hypothetical protein
MPGRLVYIGGPGLFADVTDHPSFGHEEVEMSLQS